MMNERQRQQETGSRATGSAIFRFTACAALITVCVVFWPRDARASGGVTNLPSDTPKTFTPRTNDFDYVKREEMIPMRDGVKLKTFILVPKGATNAPILLSRTPYHASTRVARVESPHLAAVVPQMDDTAVAAGYIIVYQDVRGK